MTYRTHRSRRVFVALIAALFGTLSSLALDKEGLELVFEDDFENGAARWVFFPSEDWAVEKEEGAENHVLSIVRPGGKERPHLAPRLLATPKDVTAGSFVLEARLRHRGKVYAHQDLCIAFNGEDENQFYYVHLAPEPDDGAHTIFVVDHAERKSIATYRSDGVDWGDTWHNVRLTRDVDSGEIQVFFDDMAKPIMVAKDRRFTTGSIGIGSYNDTGCFDDVRVWAPDTPTKE